MTGLEPLAYSMIERLVFPDQKAEHADRTIKENELTRYDVILWRRTEDVPVFLIKERDENQGPKLNFVTERLAQKLAFAVDWGRDLQPNQLLWYEQNKETKEIEKVTFVRTGYDNPHHKGWMALPNREVVTLEQLMAEVARPIAAVATQQLEQSNLHTKTLTQSDDGQTQKIAEEFMQQEQKRR